MVQQCVVYGCSQTVSHLINLHEFPKSSGEPQRHELWVKFVQRTRQWSGPSARSVICSQHFQKDCFENLLKVEMGFSKILRLCETAVPTIYNVGTSATAKSTFTSAAINTDDMHPPSAAPVLNRRAYRKCEVNWVGCAL